MDLENKLNTSALFDNYNDGNNDTSDNSDNSEIIGGGHKNYLDKKDITTILRITKFEYPVIISTRTLQIDKGSKVFINPDKYNDSYLIAMEEFKRDLIPYIIKRPINKQQGKYEYIRILDLYHPLKYKNNI